MFDGMPGPKQIVLSVSLEYSGTNLALKVFSPGNKPESQIQIVVVALRNCSLLILLGMGFGRCFFHSLCFFQY